MRIERGQMYSFGEGSKQLVIVNTAGQPGQGTVELGDPPVVKVVNLQGGEVERLDIRKQPGFVKDTGHTALDVSVN